MELTKQQEKIQSLIDEIFAIIATAKQMEKVYESSLSKVHPKHLKSARNLIHYRALRTVDLRPLQKRLGNLGLSRFAKSEPHVLASLLANKSILEAFIKHGPIQLQRADLTIKKSLRLDKSNAKSLLGYRSKGRRTRIMVTLPSTANYQMIYDMISSGMNCARINLCPR